MGTEMEEVVGLGLTFFYNSATGGALCHGLARGGGGAPTLRRRAA